jgi:homoserine/homoserine lactone efflux protein
LRLDLSSAERLRLCRAVAFCFEVFCLRVPLCDVFFVASSSRLICAPKYRWYESKLYFGMLFVFVGMTLLAALTPGLAVLLVTSNALKKGFAAAWRAMIGIEIGNAIYIVASATGLTALLVACAPLFTAVRWAGAIYLIYLGIRLIIVSLRPTTKAELASRVRALNPLLQGVSTQLGNPKALLYWTALFPQFLDRTHDLLPQFFLLGTSVICVETVVLTGYALATVSARKAIAGPPFMKRVIDGISGGFFVAVGLLLGTKSAEA